MAHTPKKRTRGTGSIYKQKGSEIYWVKFHCNGIPFRESTGTRNRTKALEYLNSRLRSRGPSTKMLIKDLTRSAYKLDRIKHRLAGVGL